MRSLIPLLALFSAGVFAHPALKHLQLAEKRDRTVTTTIGNQVIVEDIEDVYVTVPPGGQMPESTPTATPKAPIKRPVAPVAPAPSVSSPSAVPQSSASAAPEPSETSTPVSSGTFWAQSPKSPLSGGAGSKDVLSQANYWRQKWLGLPPFTWSSTLADNAYKTATTATYYTTENGKQVPHNEGGATVMGHELYPGSHGQCIIEGDDTAIKNGLTPFDRAWLGWICEEPNNNIPCDQIGNIKYNGDTGHAEIIKSSSYSQIGCYYMDSTSSTSFKVGEAHPPVCDIVEYGEPDASSCLTLLNGGEDEAFSGIKNMDFRDHAFLPLWAAGEKDFTTEQWRHRFYLPVKWENPLILKTNPPSTHFAPKYDTGFWATVAADAEKLVWKCLDPSEGASIPSGGRGSAGEGVAVAE
ncbi:hypothetical protein ACLMJK_005822 [Lecanora helva]